MLCNASQVLIRNEELFAQGKWLLVNPPEANVFRELSCKDLSGFHQYFDVYEKAARLHLPEKQSFAAVFEPESLFDGAVVYMPKAKQHAKMLLANIASYIKPGGQLMLVGENKEGIKSSAKLLEPFGDRVNKLDSARHCSLFCTQIKEGTPEFKLQDWLHEYEIQVNEQVFPLCSLPGVFSHGELDAGTALLLEQDYPKLSGNVLDFACGAGVIAISLGLTHPGIKLTLSDINALGLFCAEKSLKLNNLEAAIVPSNGLGNINDKFDAVFTNPPFHTGVKTDYSITQDFIRDIKNQLKPGAELVLVANRFLKYPQILEDTLGNVSTIAQTSKFNLYRCLKHPS